MRDRKNTERQILDAVERIVTRSGFAGLGINAIAKEAGVSKVLIYRYFGNYEGLIETWATENSYWATAGQDINEKGDAGETAVKLLSAHLSYLRSSPLRREIQRWLLLESTKTGKKVMSRIEKRGLELTRFFADKNTPASKKDLEPVLALITAGITHLALMADRCDVYNGVPLNNEKGWKRLEKSIEQIVRFLTS